MHVDSTPRPLVLSRKKTAETLNLSEDTVDRLVARGDLEKVRVSDRRVGITWRSILKHVEGATH